MGPWLRKSITHLTVKYLVYLYFLRREKTLERINTSVASNDLITYILKVGLTTCFHEFGNHDSTIFFSRKDQIILAPVLGILADFWVSPLEIESSNLQNLLVFGFPETSQNLESGRQLLYSSFQRGDSLKKSENPRNLPKLPQTETKMIGSFYFTCFSKRWQFSIAIKNANNFFTLLF